MQPDPTTLASLAQACAQGQQVSRVASVVPLNQAIDALAALERARANGKIVVNVADTTGPTSAEQTRRPALPTGAEDTP